VWQKVVAAGLDIPNTVTQNFNEDGKRFPLSSGFSYKWVFTFIVAHLKLPFSADLVCGQLAAITPHQL
jgi:hypothetical protein